MLDFSNKNSFKFKINQSKYPHIHDKYNITSPNRTNENRQDKIKVYRFSTNATISTVGPNACKHPFSLRKSQNSAGTNTETEENELCNIISSQTLFSQQESTNQDYEDPQLKKKSLINNVGQVKDDIKFQEDHITTQRNSENSPQKQDLRTVPSPELKKFSKFVSLESFKKIPELDEDNILVQSDTYNLTQKSLKIIGNEQESSESIKIKFHDQEKPKTFQSQRVKVKIIVADPSVISVDSNDRVNTDVIAKPKYIKQKQTVFTPRPNFKSLIPNEVPVESLFKSEANTPISADAGKFQQRQIQRLNHLPCSYRKYKFPVLIQPEMQVIVVPPIRQREMLIESSVQFRTLRLSQDRLMTRQQHERGTIRFKSLNQQKIEQHYRNIDCAQGQDLLFISNDRLVRAEQQRKLLCYNQRHQSHQ